jgi:hypothetical protein
MAKSDSAIRQAEKQRRDLDKTPEVRIEKLGSKDIRKTGKKG